MDDISQIARLASIIKTNTDKIDEHLKLEGAQSPTLAVDANPDVILPQELRLAQSQILEACTDLQALLEGPRAYLTRITSPRVRGSFPREKPKATDFRADQHLCESPRHISIQDYHSISGRRGNHL